jgi:hypothetical protein
MATNCKREICPFFMRVNIKSSRGSFVIVIVFAPFDYDYDYEKNPGK